MRYPQQYTENCRDCYPSADADRQRKKHCRNVSENCHVDVSDTVAIVEPCKCCLAGQNEKVFLDSNLAHDKPRTGGGGDFMAIFRNIRNTLSRYFPFNRRRVKKSFLKAIGTVAGTILLLAFFQLYYGVFEKVFLQSDFREGFRYPLDVPDFDGLVESFIESEGMMDFQPSPINMNYSDITFLQNPESVSNDTSVGILIIVKSAAWNYRKRMAIRKTWGNVNYLKDHYITPELPTKMAFMCGIPPGSSEYDLFPNERKFDDIILAQFQDSYGNNTFKTLLLMRWAIEYVKDFKYLMVVDDDMYVSPSNIVHFVGQIPYIQVQNITSSRSGASAFYPIQELQQPNNNHSEANGDVVGDVVSLVGKPLIMGKLWVDSRPFRNAMGGGAKWALSIEEYPYNFFPPYVAGAATLIDSTTVAKLYYGALFTRHFWIDDVYIGILAKKLGITLTNSELIDSSYRSPTAVLKHDFSEMIAIHGLECPEQLVELWQVMDIEALRNCNELRHLL